MAQAVSLLHATQRTMSSLVARTSSLDPILRVLRCPGQDRGNGALLRRHREVFRSPGWSPQPAVERAPSRSPVDPAEASAARRSLSSRTWLPRPGGGPVRPSRPVRRSIGCRPSLSPGCSGRWLAAAYRHVLFPQPAGSADSRERLPKECLQRPGAEAWSGSPPARPMDRPSLRPRERSQTVAHRATRGPEKRRPPTGPAKGSAAGRSTSNWNQSPRSNRAARTSA